MPVIVKDETGTGTVLNSFTLADLNEVMTLREIIKARIYQEVTDFNRKEAELSTFNGLVQPGEVVPTIPTPNGVRKRRVIDWEEQVEKALAAFETNGFFVLVDDKQAESLDQRFDVAVETTVSFVKLVPLVGG